MGYTHHWEVAEKIDNVKWHEFTIAVRKILTRASMPIVGGNGDIDSFPTIDDNVVSFNGVDENSHETFYVDRNKPGYAFCKTDRKPYDEVVVACWIAGEAIGVFSSIGSDGMYDDDQPFDDGKALYTKAMGKKVKSV